MPIRIQATPTYFCCRIVLLVFSALCGCKTGMVLPGEVMLSSADWNHIAYFDGRSLRHAGVRKPIAAAKLAPTGKVYVLTDFRRNEQGDLVGNSLAQLRPDGSVVTLFAQENKILSFSVTTTGLVALSSYPKGCPTLLWIRYDGNLYRSLPAPCTARDPEAVTEEKVLLTVDGPPPDHAPRIIALKENRFEPVFEGYAPSWTSLDRFIYQDTHHCVREATLNETLSTVVLCGAVFEQAASPDGRFIVVHVGAGYGPFGIPLLFAEAKELRVFDRKTGRHVTVVRGSLPYSTWVSSTPVAEADNGRFLTTPGLSEN